MRKILLIFSVVMACLTSCKNDDEPEVTKPVNTSRTVLVYMSGENNLTMQYGIPYLQNDINEMLEGSKTLADNQCLLVYVDVAKSAELPYLARVKNGMLVDSVSISDMNISDKDEYSCNPNVMESVIRYAFNNYPSEKSDYGLVLWGHSTGWLIEDSIPYTAMARRGAYGGDTGNNRTDSQGVYWLNIPTMAKLLGKLPHLKYIFADCCNFQCVETAYELRNQTDYIIGSPAEIPGTGAPYATVVPALFDETMFWKSITDKYYEQGNSYEQVPLSVIKTSEMENLAQATRQVLSTFVPQQEEPYPNMSRLIHYYYDYRRYKFYDMNDFILKYASAEDYTTWKTALDKAVVYKLMATRWVTNVRWGDYYSDFTMSEEKYGGISMFVPQWNYMTSINDEIKKLGWYKAAGLQELGW